MKRTLDGCQGPFLRKREPPTPATGKGITNMTVGDLHERRKGRFVPDGAANGDRLLAQQVESLLSAMSDPRLSRRHQRVLTALAECDDVGGGRVSPGADALASTTGYSQRVVYTVLGDLARFGYVSATRRAPPSGGKARAFYSFAAPDIQCRPKMGEDRRRTRGVRANLGDDAERHSLRSAAVAAFGQRCEYCGERGSASGVIRHHKVGWPSIDRWHLDRIIPGARGGRYEAANVTLACARCNMRKSDADFIGPVRSFSDMVGGVNEA